ncbi:Glyoxylate/hydroxypyruvate reductase A [Roseovarius gaetbuli]|uniref:Glyoxylate/hydroxypyruvate reductase A n=1 Tax=Roseovarius gaetbuli TaxID=1356575 RepID=A0A1X6ZNN4_9RHOB|nr:glyoxylate/hydroxypyruvate reductase A [Roseovarius gaetbuli]SLN56925.1 Glyoxylate/hydroxypyruvate reductase A [Roseovarius gaetbuli]
MPVNVLFAARPERWETYEAPLRAALSEAGVEANLATQMPAHEVDYIVYAPNSGVEDFAPFTRAKAVLNLWAGVEDVVGNPTLHLPLARMVDHGLTQGMVEWVTGHVLRHHLGMDAHILGQDGIWRKDIPPLAQDRRVTMLGLGALGQACAEALGRLGFAMTGWSRSQKEIDGVTCLSGDQGLRAALQAADILVLLLPLTGDTENILNRETLAYLPHGAVIVNPGRGPLIDDDALLAALDSGDVGHATLDVFREEPLPMKHPFWAHPQVTVTPHIASETRQKSASQVIAENIRRGEAGEPFIHLVNRELGY